MNGRLDNSMIIAIVVLLVLGSVVLFAMSTFMSDMNKDKHIHSHEYVFSGTLNGEECTGFGNSVYVEETTREYIYEITYELSSNNNKFKSDFGLVFDHDENLTSSTDRYEGEEIIDDMVTKVWSRMDKNSYYKFWIGEYCELVKVSISSDNLQVTGTVSN